VPERIFAARFGVGRVWLVPFLLPMLMRFGRKSRLYCQRIRWHSVRSAKVFLKTSWIPQIILKPKRVGYAFLVGYDAALFASAQRALMMSSSRYCCRCIDVAAVRQHLNGLLKLI